MSDSIKNVAGFNYRYTESGKKVRTKQTSAPIVKDQVTINKEKPIRDDSRELAKMANKAAVKSSDETTAAPVRTETAKAEPKKADTPKTDAGKTEEKKETDNKGFWSRLFKVGSGATLAAGFGVAGAAIGTSIGITHGMTAGLAIGTAIAGPIGGALGMVVGLSSGLVSGLFTGSLIGAGVGSLFGAVVATS